MLTVLKEQLDAWEAVQIQKANVRLVRYLRERFPEQAHTRRSEELTRFVVAARDRAKAHGILEEPDVATALDLTVMYGADFYSATWVRDVFAMTEWSGSKKLDVIRARVRRQIHDF